MARWRQGLAAEQGAAADAGALTAFAPARPASSPFPTAPPHQAKFNFPDAGYRGDKKLLRLLRPLADTQAAAAAVRSQLLVAPERPQHVKEALTPRGGGGGGSGRREKKSTPRSTLVRGAGLLGMLQQSDGWEGPQRC